MSYYQDLILDHYRYPRNASPLDNPDVQQELHNPLCGDTIKLDLRIEDNTITGIGYTASGCAISVASASLLSEAIKGKPLSYVQSLTKDDIIELLGIGLSPNRLKCALLSLEAAQKASKTY